MPHCEYEPRLFGAGYDYSCALSFIVDHINNGDIFLSSHQKQEILSLNNHIQVLKEENADGHAEISKLTTELSAKVREDSGQWVLRIWIEPVN